MSDLDKLREALDRLENEVKLWKAVDETADKFLSDVALAASTARDYLALLESDAIVIKRDAEGNWPEWALEMCEQWHYPCPADCQPQVVKWTPTDLLNGLADSSKAPE